MPIAVEIPGNPPRNVLQGSVGRNDRLSVSTMVVIQKATRLFNVTNNVSLLRHHHNNEFGAVAVVREDYGCQIRKIRAIPALSSEGMRFRSCTCGASSKLKSEMTRASAVGVRSF